MGFAWMAAGVFGLLGTSFYEIIVKSYGVVSAGVAGALMHLFFVIGTIGGLFIKGSFCSKIGHLGSVRFLFTFRNQIEVITDNLKADETFMKLGYVK